MAAIRGDSAAANRGKALTAAQLGRLHAAQDAKKPPSVPNPLAGPSAPAWMPKPKVTGVSSKGRFDTAPFKPSALVPLGRVVKSLGGGPVVLPSGATVLKTSTGPMIPRSDALRTKGPSNNSASLLGHLPGGNVLARGLSNISTGLNYSPAGLYQMGRAAYKDAGAAFNGKPVHYQRDLYKGMAKGEASALAHPGRHPEAIPLALLGGVNAVASVGERLGAAGEAADGLTGAGRVRAALGAAAKKPIGGLREIHSPEGGSTLALNSEAPLSRLLQRQADKAAGVHKAGVNRKLLTGVQEHRFKVHQQRTDRIVNEVAAAAPKGALRDLTTTPGKVQSKGFIADTAPQAMRIVNRASRDAILYKPGYLPTNLLGQLELSGVSQGVTAPLNMLRAAKTAREMSKTGVARRSALAGIGSNRALNLAGGGKGLLKPIDKAVGFVDSALGNAAGKVIDTPTRHGEAVYQLRRHGIKTAADQERALALLAQHGVNLKTGALRPGSLPRGEAKQALEAGLRTRQAQIDFDTLGPTGNALRNALFFVPWLKGSSLYAGHFFRDHPAQAAATVAGGQYGKKHAGLGPHVPSFMEGDFAVGKRKVPGLGTVPTMVNPNATTVVNQAPQLAATAAGVLGLTSNKPGIDPQNMLAPFWYSTLAAITRKDPFTGHQFPQTGAGAFPQVFAHEFKNEIPAYTDLWKGGFVHALTGHGPTGKTDPTKVLFPRTPADNGWRFNLGGLHGTPVNPVEQESRWRAEQTAGESRSAGVASKMGYYRQDFLNQLNKLGAPGAKPFTRLPAPIETGIQRSAAIQQAALKVRDMSPNAKTSHGTLSSVGSLAAQFTAWAADSKMAPADRDIVVKAILAINPADTSKVKEMTSTLSFLSDWRQPWSADARYTKLLNQLMRKKFPFANGGAPVAIPSTR